MKPCRFRITHPDVPDQRQVAVEGSVQIQNDTFLEIYLDGYSTADMIGGPPVCICLDNDQEPVLYVWADIKNDAPSHVIPLVGAKEPVAEAKSES